MTTQLGLFPDLPTPEPTPRVQRARVRPELREIASALPRGLRLGTSSWSFPGWEGLVYAGQHSERVLAREGLGAYAKHPLFRSVGLDRTYYRPIDAATFSEYADAVSADFRFLVKADRLLTSPSDPTAGGFRRPNPLFLDPAYAIEEVIGPMIEGLGRKAGPLLFQFPPLPPSAVGGRDTFAERLHDFLAGLPEGPLYTIELRTAALMTEGYADALLDVGASHCYTVHPAMASLERQFATVQAYRQPALVVRWMLHSGYRYEVAKERYRPFDRIVDPDPESRERIAVAALDAAIAERPGFIIANNKAEGSAPRSIAGLAERIAKWEPEDTPEPGSVSE